MYFQVWLPFDQGQHLPYFGEHPAGDVHPVRTGQLTLDGRERRRGYLGDGPRGGIAQGITVEDPIHDAGQNDALRVKLIR